VYTLAYTCGMTAEPLHVVPLSVREMREQMSQVLQRFRNGELDPVFVGSRRHAEAVLVPAEVYDELVAARAKGSADAVASLRAEGLASSAEADAISGRWASGQISTAEMRRQIRALHGLA
jgi:antitoxin (DNA-binding transcriptional repressor) of toxin-antitoxin stability system